MKVRFSVPVLALILIPAFTASPQSTLTLQRTTAEPKVDGVIEGKEYSLSADAPDMQLNLSWVKEVLYVGVSGQTRGWVAIGIGPGLMDGSTIYIGFVRGGRTEFRVQRGSGHSHGDTKGEAPERHAMREAGDRTVLELALKASEFLSPGQRQLDVILAMGASDSFGEYHQSRYGAVVSIVQ